MNKNIIAFQHIFDQLLSQLMDRKYPLKMRMDTFLEVAEMVVNVKEEYPEILKQIKEDLILVKNNMEMEVTTL